MNILITRIQPILANFGIFWLFLVNDWTKSAGNAVLWQAQHIATPFISDLEDLAQLFILTRFNLTRSHKMFDPVLTKLIYTSSAEYFT